jgi:hypothetical protein
MSVDLGSVAQTLLKGTKRTETTGNPAPIDVPAFPTSGKKPRAKRTPKTSAIKKTTVKKTPGVKKRPRTIKDIHPPPPDRTTNRVPFQASTKTNQLIRIDDPITHEIPTDSQVYDEAKEIKKQKTSSSIDLDALFDFNALTLLMDSKEIPESTREVPNDVLPNIISPFIADAKELNAMAHLQPTTTDIHSDEGESKNEEIGKLMMMPAMDRRVLFNRSIQSQQPSYPIESFTSSPNLGKASFIRRATEGISQTLPVNGAVYA